MASKKSGVNTAIAKKTYNNVQTAMNTLNTHMNDLVKNVEKMNKDDWYGGKSANNWYKKMITAYSNLYKFHSGVVQFQNSLHTVFSKSSASGIDF